MKKTLTPEEKETRKDIRNAMIFLGILGAIVVAGGAAGAALTVHETGHGAGIGFLFGSFITGSAMYIKHSMTNDEF